MSFTITTFWVLSRHLWLPYWTAQLWNIFVITESSVGQHWLSTLSCYQEFVIRCLSSDNYSKGDWVRNFSYDRENERSWLGPSPGPVFISLKDFSSLQMGQPLPSQSWNHLVISLNLTHNSSLWTRCPGAAWEQWCLGGRGCEQLVVSTPFRSILSKTAPTDTRYHKFPLLSLTWSSLNAT